MTTESLPDEVVKFGAALLGAPLLVEYPEQSDLDELWVLEPWKVFGRVVEAMRERGFTLQFQTKNPDRRGADLWTCTYRRWGVLPAVGNHASARHESPAIAALMAAHEALGGDAGGEA